MDGTLIILFSLIGLTVVLILMLMLRPSLTATKAGKVLAFVALFILPIMSGGFGVTTHMEHAKRTEFCLSCHIMGPYGKSLHVDAPNYLAARHFINHRIPADEACYTCHGDYTLFGDEKAKARGLRHVWVQYTSDPKPPLHLYNAYSNLNCLHCHEGARTFEEGATHNADPDIMKAIKADTMSCMTSGCHDTVHATATLDKVKFWPAAKGATK